MTNGTQTKMDIKYLTRVGMLTALAFVIMLLEIPLFPPLQLDFSDAIALFGGVAFGPFAAILIEVLKNVLHFILKNSGGIGEIANLVVGIAFVVPSSIIYRKISNQKGLVIGMLVGSISMVAIALVANYFIFLPLYIAAYPEYGINKLEFTVYTVLPFNIVKAVLSSIVAFIIFNAFQGVMKYLKLHNK